MDGVGEWTTTSMGTGRGDKITVERVIRWPNSLGLLYSAFTYHAGFTVNSGEYKLMGLAPYGEPRFRDDILGEVIDLKPDGSFRLNQRYFDYATGLRMTSALFDRRFGGPARDPRAEITQREMDLAASVQSVVEEAILRTTRTLAQTTGLRSLCMAGGVALNCVANGKIVCDDAFADVWVQPSPGDAGAALAVYHSRSTHGGRRPSGDRMAGSLLGPRFGQSEVEAQLNRMRADFSVLDDRSLMSAVAEVLAAGKTVGWFQGRMEFGPRALGARSILADPRRAEMRSTLNLKIKYRESFRPFAPAVLREEAASWFDLAQDSPFMSLVVGVLCRWLWASVRPRLAKRRKTRGWLGWD